MADKSTSQNTIVDYETIRQELLKAEMLVTDIELEKLTHQVSDTDISAMLPIQLQNNTASWSDLLDEDRGTY